MFFLMFILPLKSNPMKLGSSTLSLSNLFLVVCTMLFNSSSSSFTFTSSFGLVKFCSLSTSSKRFFLTAS